jgi:hypothetical protein
VTGPAFTYLVGTCGYSGHIKIGSSADLPRRLRSLRESRTVCPPAARGRQIRLFVAWTDGDGPSEAALLSQFTDARWRTPTGHASEWVATHHPDVRAFLDETTPGWQDLLRCNREDVRPIRREEAPT